MSRDLGFDPRHTLRVLAKSPGGIVSNGMIDVDERRVPVFRNAIGSGFLETLGMRLVAGRMPGLPDGLDALRAARVDPTVAPGAE